MSNLYEDDLTINEAALDVEWLSQPRLMLKYTRLAAEARKMVSATKEKRDVVRATKRKEILSDPEKFGLAKTTEAVVEGAIVVSTEYEEVNAAYIEAVYEAEILEGAVRAIDQKKTALENLVRLHAASYFAGPSVPRDLSYEKKKEDQRREVSQAANKAVRITRTRA